MVAPFLYVAAGVVATFAAFFSLGVTRIRRELRATEGLEDEVLRSPVLEVPGLEEASLEWHATEPERMSAIVGDTPMFMAYAEVLHESVDDILDFEYEHNEDAIVGGWVAAVSMLTAWNSYKGVIAPMLQEKDLGRVVNLFDALVLGATQPFMFEAAAAAGVEAIDPVDRVSNMIQLVNEIHDIEGQAWGEED